MSQLLAIHHRPGSFSDHWIRCCEERGIPYKLVNCYGNDILKQMQGCIGLMWHFHHAHPKDVLFAKQLMYSLQTAGYRVFPDSNTCWHFDDKVGQKYLLEAIGAPLVPTYVFYEKRKALEWVEIADFPKVFKLRRGAGSAHVRLVKSRWEARRLVRKAFGRGFSQYNRWANLRERWRKYREGQTNLGNVLRGVARLGYTTGFSRVVGREKGYIYFQDFLSDNEFDIRVNIVDGKCFACTRPNRRGDFRASGSGFSEYDLDKIPISVIKVAFEIAGKLTLQIVAFDFVDLNGKVGLFEISYGFGVDPLDFEYGYWEKDLNFVSGKFNPYEWMIYQVLD